MQDIVTFPRRARKRGHYVALQGHFFSPQNAPVLKSQVRGHYIALQGHFFFTENVPLLKNKVLGHYVALQGHFFSQKTSPFLKIWCEGTTLPCRGTFFAGGIRRRQSAGGPSWSNLEDPGNIENQIRQNPYS